MVRVAAAIIEKDGRILIARRKKEDPLKNKWEFPGGKVEPRETPEECLKRELREELGIDIEVGKFFCSSTFAYSHISIELLVYRVTSFSGEITLNDHTEVTWVSPAELVAYDFPEADIPVIQKLRGAFSEQNTENAG